MSRKLSPVPPPAPVPAPAMAVVASPWTRWIAVGLFLATALLFARAIGGDFVNYDDPGYVTDNPRVKAGFSADGLAWALRSGEQSNWHPLTWLSHQLDATIFGLDPRGHHATSVLLHALNAALAFLALRRLTGALWTSALCAVWFAWHPLRVESVAWVAERKDVLSGFFFFATLWAYAIYAERRREQRPGAGRFYALTFAALALGLMAKPMLVTLPCVAAAAGCLAAAPDRGRKTRVTRAGRRGKLPSSRSPPPRPSRPISCSVAVAP